MLIWMRDGAGAGVLKILLMSMLVLAVVGLVLMDVGGFFRGDLSQGTIIKGGGLNVSAMEFDRSARRAISSQGISPEEAYRLGLIDNLVQSEIQSRLFTKAASDLGLKISDEAVRKQISTMAGQLAGEGQSKKQQLQQILRTQGISESEFVGAIRQEMANNLLRAGLSASPKLTSPLMAESLYRYDNEKRAAQAIVLTHADIKNVDAPTDEALQKYHDANKMDFLVPETRTITIATLKADMIKNDLDIAEDDIRAAYDKNIASYTKPERRTVEQAVFSEKPEADKIVKAVESGKSLKDATPSGSYVGTQDYEPSGLLPELSAPVFKADKGTLVGPIQTSLGWHLLQVKDTIPAIVTPYADVKASIKSELEQAALGDEMFNIGNTIEDRAASGESLETLIAEYGMTTEKIGPFRVNGTDENRNDLFKSYAADRTKLIENAFDYDEGEITPIVETADGQFRIVRVDSVTPDSHRAFADVKSGLEKRWLNEQRRLAAKAQTKSILDDLNSGKTLEGAVKDHGGTIRTFGNINRKEAPAAPLNAIVAAQIFSTDLGKPFSAEIENAHVVGVVTSITMPDTVPADSKEMRDLGDLVGQSLPQDIFGQYVSSLSEGSKIRVNQRQLQALYGVQPTDGAQ